MSSIKLGLIVSLFLWITVFSLKQQVEKPLTRVHLRNNTADTLSGRQLAGQYCRACHLFPDPSSLDKATWTNSVLPNMGLRLGVKSAGRNPYEDLPDVEINLIREQAIYPETQLISDENWAKIVKYYETEAPSEPLPQKAVPPVTNSLPLFKAQEIKLGDKPFPQTTLLKFDPATSLIYVGDAQHVLYVLDNKFKLKNSRSVESPPVDMDFPKNAEPRFLTIGLFQPSEQKLGKLISLETISSSSALTIQNLHRPVQFATSDLNMDGKEDAIICEFGNHTGKLVWLDDFQPSKEHVLKEFPGARKVEVADFNQDKKPDLMVLMGQAREQISIFYNLGNGEFKEKTLLRFPPQYGMSYFELVDFNKDGFKDILATNGDNWDYSAIKKNYHGVRIYLNDGKDNFKESYFYPLYGAAKAVARDFDHDGDIDIAAVSFYTELENPQQQFIYLSNKGDLNFQVHSTPEAATGKWMTMEAADFDHDGDIDIILGSYFHNLSEFTKLAFQGVLSFPQVLVLRNTKK
ncbi:VCBS repeat-containing protein [Dyadobacter sp. CY356]|uniref:FG-GAP repeat domain-containing protein n=1 Tax=Dyadobacter sp. CY356 TaxID=2906442 RepID=UPI001F1AB849|nr:VCBS repeat-containing protein [Dyadobacter sp. CY356]MCF0056656.1 VCBS repeat-containing protein [Dyadobacter sp. CY356]